ncbi:MAG TPA: SDR family oxidoreductase [Thermomicrobiales bacterium]|nr:SDR family oxidoreductase [Thermomicrobiales bacterium]
MSTPQQPRRLAGKTALVTGSTRGLGRTMAEWLAREGADIVVSGREADEAPEAVAALRALGVEAFGIPADLSHVAEAHRLAEETLARVAHLDILVNNAGMSIRGPFWEVGDADWEYQVNVNYRAPFILAQHAARHMLAHRLRGRIVNISTIGAHGAHRDAAVYDSAKAAVEAMTRNMALELAPHGISVNCVIPGAISERPGVTPSPDRWARAARHIPFGRVGRAEDIAAAVLFFCLSETEFTTGQSLLVDGAHHAYLPEG